MTISQYVKEIRYNRYTKDYDLTLDGEYVGSAKTHHEGETKLDQLVYDLLMGQSPAEACKMNVLGTRWTVCGASSDGPCMCDVIIKATSDNPAPPDLATDLYNVVCLVLSGAGATTAISELRRVQSRYESEVGK